MIRFRGAAALVTLSLPLTLVTVVGLGALGGPAAADTKAVGDRVDNKFADYSDITGLTVRNGPTTFKATIRLRAVDPKRTVATAVLFPATGTGIYVVGTKAGGAGRRPLFFQLAADGKRKVDCPGLEVDVDRVRDQVRVSFPQACLGTDAGTLGVSALTEVGTTDQDATKKIQVPRS